MKVQIELKAAGCDAEPVSEPFECENESSNLTEKLIRVLRYLIVQPGDTYTVKVLDED